MTSDYPRTFWLLVAGTLVNRIGLLVLPFLSLYLTSARGLTVAQATLVIGLHGAGSFAAGITGGTLSDAVGRKTVLVGSLAGGAVLMASIPLAAGFASMAALVLAYGFVGEMYRPAVSAVVADTVDPARRKRAFALLYWAINVGAALGPAIGGLLAEHSFRLLFTADAASMAIYAAVVAVGVAETRPERPVAVPGARGVLSDALRDRRLVGLTLVTLAVGTAFVQSYTTLPLAMRAQGIAPGAYGLVIGLNGLLVVLLSLPVARWMEARHRPGVLAGAVVLIALGIGTYALAETPWGYAGGVVLWSIGEVAFLPIVPAIVAALAPERARGTYQGVYQSGWGMAHTVGPIAGGAVLTVFSADALWGAGLVLCLAAAAGIVLGGLDRPDAAPA